MRHRHSAVRGIRAAVLTTSVLATVCLLPLAGCGGNDTAQRQQEADAIAKGIEAYLGMMTDPNQPVGLRHDKVTVTPNQGDKSFAVTITGIKFADAKGTGLNVGEVDYRLTPQDANTYQVSDLKVPQDLPILGEDGKAAADIKFETTAFTAVWSTPLQNFLKLDWQAKNVSVTAADQPNLVAKADSLAIEGDGKDNGKGQLNQTSTFTVSGISVVDPTDGTDFTLAKVTGKVGFDDFDFTAYRTQMLKLKSLMAKIAPAVAAEAQGMTGGTAAPETPAAQMTDDDRKALADVIGTLPKTMSGYSYGLSAEGLVVKDKDGATPAKLAEGGMDFALKGLNTDKAELDFGLKHSGLELSGPEFTDPMVQALLPKSGDLSVAATDIPVPALVDAVVKQIPQLTSSDPSVAQGGQFALMGALMSALSQSTIKVRVDPSHINAEKAQLTADGELKLALNSPTMAVGALNLALKGLDEVITMANAMAQTSPDAADAIGMLQMMKGIAKREDGGDGKPVDKFAVEFAPTGAITVNGKPLEGLMQ